MRRSLLRAIAAVGLACGCAGGPTPRTHYWRLEAPAPGGEAPVRLPGVVQVERPSASGLLQTRPLLVSDAARPNALAQYDYHVWTEAPPELVQRTLADHLRAAGVARRVVTPELRVPADYVVSGRLRRFERVRAAQGDRVAVELDLVLRRSADGALLWQGSYRSERALRGEDMDAAVSSLGEAAGDVYARFVADLAAETRPVPAAAAEAGPVPAAALEAGPFPAAAAD